MRGRHHLPYDAKDDFALETSASFLSLWNDISQSFFIVTIAIVSISLVVGGIVIMNIMLGSMTERHPDAISDRVFDGGSDGRRTRSGPGSDGSVMTRPTRYFRKERLREVTIDGQLFTVIATLQKRRQGRQLGRKAGTSCCNS